MRLYAAVFAGFVGIGAVPASLVLLGPEQVTVVRKTPAIEHRWPTVHEVNIRWRENGFRPAYTANDRVQDAFELVAPAQVPAWRWRKAYILAPQP